MYAGEDCPKVDPVPIDPPKRPAPSYTFCSEIQPGSKRTSCLKFSPDGRYLAVGSPDKSLRILMLHEETWEPIGNREFLGHKLGINDINWSPDARLLCTASDDRTLQLWSAATGKHVGSLRGHDNYAFCCAFYHITTIFSGGFDSLLRVWDVATQSSIRTISAHTEPLSSVATVRHGNLMATASYDGLLRLWDTTSLKLANTLKPVDDDKWPVSFVRFSPNGKFVLAGYHNSKIRLWDVNNGKALRIYEGHQQSKYCTPTHFAITGGKYIISGSEDGDVVAWDMQDASILQRWRAHESPVIASDCHPRSNLLVTAALDDDYSIKRWTSPQ